jgi:hypothetical protein
LGFDFERGDLGSWINLQFEAATGRVFELHHCWPELEVPFVVTALPSVEEVQSFHQMGSNPARNITSSHSDNVTYRRASMYYEMGIEETAPVRFYLPYWNLLQYAPGWWSSISGQFGVIFPDKELFIIH